MIADIERYANLGSSGIHERSWVIADHDQRRVVAVTVEDDQFTDETADTVITYYSRHGSQIPTDVYWVNLSSSGELVSIHTDPQYDETYALYYPLLRDIKQPKGTQIVRRDQLLELERLASAADLVAYSPSAQKPSHKAVFKYHYIHQRTATLWTDMNIWMRLPPHPNIVPFERIVVNEAGDRVVGFTSTFIPGGDLCKNEQRVFKLDWLQQLIKTIDELNLRYCIAHQDIAPRNLVVDEKSDSIMIFDFGVAARMRSDLVPQSQEYWSEDRNDVKGTIFSIYEIITQDYTLRSKPHREQDLSELPLEWIQHPNVRLDSPVEMYQSTLREWQKRRSGWFMSSHRIFPYNPVSEKWLRCFSETLRMGSWVKETTPINWPPRPKRPQKTSTPRKKPSSLSDNNGRSPIWDRLDFEPRRYLRAVGDTFITWERPPQKVLDMGTRVLANGQVLSDKGTSSRDSSPDAGS